ncbi:MAG: ParB-like protein [Pseudomonadota bacterium]
MLLREPRLETATIVDLRPTQITMGMREVTEKRRHWRTLPHQAKFLGSHLIPVIHGPKGRYYVIDHHHLARALLDEGLKEVAITVVADLGRLEKDEFWTFLDNRGWLHPYDATGARQPYSALPRRISDLEDDPFRSLAGELRRAGGFAKDTTPFSEFLWADFLRRRIARREVDKRFASALAASLELARSRDADHLPGWCGPITR